MARPVVDARTAFRAEVNHWVQTAIDRLQVSGSPALEVPPDSAMGQLAMPCFPFAKELQKSPMAIAQELASVQPSEGRWLNRIEAAGPYVNFHMDLHRLASEMLVNPDAALSPEAVPGKVLVEHTSANPNGPLHVGRARNPILGDTLVRLARTSGHDVDSQYYMDNLGRQVALLWWGKQNISETELEPPGRQKPDHDLVRYYQAANEKMTSDPAVAEEIKQLVAKLENADQELLSQIRAVYEECFAGMSQSLQRLGVSFDQVKDESDLVESGAVDSVIDRLKTSPRAGVEDDGANFLDLEEELKGNKSTQFFFTRKDGTSVYATRDIAYHEWKDQQVGPDGRLLDVLGEDHRLQALQVGVALDELGARRPTVAFYAFVSLPEGKMSTRSNRVVFLDDLLDEAVERAEQAVRERRGDELDDEQIAIIAESVGIAAIRFNIARVQPEKAIKFRWEEALDFEGDSAPYIMYAHARARSLMTKAASAGILANEIDSDRIGEGEQALLAKISELNGEARTSFDAVAPQRFCAYALELAAAFNEYYRDHPVVGCEDSSLASLRLATVQLAAQALSRCHEALGLPTLDTM